MEATTSRPATRETFAGFWLALFAIALIRTAWVGDDAYFTFRTIDNFVHGFGLRWNVAERVQAYTHPLWLILNTPFDWAARDPYFTVVALSCALTLATVWLIARQAATRWTATLALTILLTSRAFIDQVC